MAVSLGDMKAKLTITAGVTGAELIDKFGGKLNTVGKTADAVNKQMASLSSTVRGLAAGFSLAGLAAFGAEAARVGIQLDAYSKQLGVGFGQYGALELTKLRDIMRSLGIAQDEALGSAVRFTSALKLSGQSMAEANRAFESASKLILSNKLSADGAQRVYYAMAQIASKGKLMSEELNGQLGDVLAGFSQQVAKAMDMTTDALYKAMQEGKVSGKQFFEALNKIGDAIDPAALDSAARSLANVKNEWFDFKESLVDTGAVKDALDAAAASLKFLSDNASLLLGVVGTGLVTALGAYIGKSVMATAASLAEAAAKRESLVQTLALAEANNVKALADLRAAEAVLAHQTALLGLAGASRAAAIQVEAAAAAVAMSEKELIGARNAALAAGAGMTTMGRGAAGLSAMLGGPLGMAITGVIVGLSAYGLASEAAEKHLEDNAHLAKQLGVQLTAQSAAAYEALNQTKGLTSATSNAIPKAWEFKNAADNLTKSLWEQAAAARAARVELLQKQMAEAKKTMDAANWYTNSGSEKNYSEGVKALSRGNPLGFISGVGQGLGADALSVITGGESARNGKRDAEQARRLFFDLQGRLDIEQNSRITKNDLPPEARTSPSAPTSTGSSKKTKGATGPTVVQIEKSYQDMLNSITQEDIKSRQEVVTTTEERFKYEQQSLTSEITEKRASLAAAKNFTTTQYRIIDQAISDLETSKKAAIEAKRRDAITHNRIELDNADLETGIEMKQLQLDMTTNVTVRRQIQLDILDAEQKIARNKLEEVIASSQSSVVEKEIAQRKLDNLPKETQAKRDRIERDNEGPLKAKMRELHKNTDDINTALENVGAKGLQSLEDGLIGVLDGTKSVAQAFSEMANQIIADLMRIAVEKFIVSTIGGLFADGGAFSGGTKMFANGGAFSGGTEFFATGGAFTNTVVTRPTAFGMANGKTGVMGEAGPEAVMPLRRTASGRLGVEVVAPRGQQAGQRPVQLAVTMPGNERVASAIGSMGSALVMAITGLARLSLSSQAAPIMRADLAPRPSAAPAPVQVAAMRRLPATGAVAAQKPAPQTNTVSVSVNVEGGGSKVDGNSENAAQLGRIVSNVVRQELVNQQRPGGLLARTR